MSFSRIKASGWSLNEKLTSAQQTQLDIDHANALDKSIAGDILEGTIQLNNANAILQLTNDGTFQVDGAGIFSLNSGSINNVNNCNFSFNTGAQLNFHSSSGCTFDSGCTLNTNGQVNLNSTVVFNSTVTGALASTWTLSGAVTAANLTISGLGNVKLASRSLTRTFGSGKTNYTGSTPYFLITAGRQSQNTVTGSPDLSIELENLPHNSVLDSISVYYSPSPGHAFLPLSMPQVLIYRLTVSTGDLLLLGTQQDTAANVGTYETVRTLTVSSLSTTIDKTQYKYVIRFFGEYSTNSQIGLLLYGGKTICTVTQYDDG